MRYGYHLAILITIVYTSLLAGQTLTTLRDIPAELTKAGSPYLITAPLTIPKGQEVIVERGVIILFNEFAGLTVNGTLRARGTIDHPITFTSAKVSPFNQDTTLFPAPFDWEGLTIGESGNLIFEEVYIQYATIGINSFHDHLELVNCHLLHNGTHDLKVLNKTYSNLPPTYSFKGTPRKWTQQTKKATTVQLTDSSTIQNNITDTVDLSVTDRSKDSLNEVNFKKMKQYTHRHRRTKLRVWGIVSVVSGGILGGMQHVSYTKAKKNFDKINQKDQSGALTTENMQNHTSEQWEKRKRKVNHHAIAMYSGYGLATMGTLLFTISFTF